MPEIPNSEPDRVTAGATIAWTRTLSGYPASVYTLKYALQRLGATLITITATADGDEHDIDVAPEVSAAWASGPYVWTAYVETAGGARYIISRGTITVLPSPLAALGSTHASRTLALIEAALEGRIPNGLESSNIDGQELTSISIEALERLQTKYLRKVLMENDAARSRAGLKVRRTIGIRFVNP